MVYRITNNMMTNTHLSDLYSNLGRLTDLQRQMSSGKLYNRPSDNPVAVVQDLSLGTSIFENEQYIKNMKNAVTWLENTDQSLNQIDSVVQRIRELAVYAGDGALEEADVEAIALEIEQLREELMMTANYAVGGNYLFAGLATGTIPFVEDDEGNIIYQGNLGNVSYEMQQSYVGQVSLNGRDVFPEQFTGNSLRSIEVPTDFTWQGRDEIIQIQVGNSSVKIHIPEQWTDDNTNGIEDTQDQNLFRDCGELDSYSLDQIAAIIRNSTEMGDVSKLVSVEVVKDEDAGTQELVIKSHTGEPVSITSWQETDYEEQPQAVFSLIEDSATWAASAEGGSITFEWGDGEIDTISFTQTEVTDKATLLGVSEIEALGALIEEKTPGIFVQVKMDSAGNAVLLLQAETRGDTFRMADMTGDAASLFGGDLVASAEVTDFEGVVIPAGGFPVTIGGTIYASVGDINSAGLGLWAEDRGTDGIFIYEITSDAAQEVTSGGTVYSPTSLFRAPNADQSHTGFASYMGMETSIQSTELPADDSVLAKDASAVMHIRLEAGSNHAELEVPAGETLTMSELAERLKGVAGDWLEVVVMTDEDESNSYNILNRGMDNSETATQKLVLRTKDGTALSVFDVNSDTATFAADLGISTALYGDASTMAIPSAAALDGNTPARLSVSVGDESFTVIISKEDVASGIDAVLASIQEQVGKDRIGYSVDGDTFALYAKNGESLEVHDLPFCDPLYSDYSAGLAMQWGIQTGIRSDAVANNATAAADGTIRIETSGRSVDISIFAGETLQDVANRIRDNVDWLDVAYLDTDPDNPGGGTASLSLTAKDGSVINVFDVEGTEASATFNMDTAIRSTGDISGWAAAAGDLLTFEFNGVEHTIDLGQMAGDGPEELVCLINSRFQGLGVQAELVDAGGGDQRLVLTSPKGYEVTITNAPAGLNLGATPVSTPSRGSAVTNSPYGQNVTVITHSEETSTDFFGLLDNLAEAIRAEDRDGISDSLLGNIDDYIDNLLKCRAQTGALINRYETSQDRLTQNNTSIEELRSKIADTDLAEAITKFSMAQSVYQASLAVIAQIVQPTLVDFLS